MSPALAVLYFLLASSPVWRHEESQSPMTSSWESRFPSTFDFDLESSSIFGGEHKNIIFESLFNNNDVESSNWLRTCPVTGLLTSTTSRHEECPICASAKLIKRIVKANPVLIEKLLTRPESLFAVEHLITKVPTYLREKIVRRLVKSILSHHQLSRRSSILSELYPTTSTFNGEESSSELSSIFRAVKLVKRIAKVHPILVKSILTRPESIVAIAKVIRRNPEVARLVEKLIQKSLFSNSRRSVVAELFESRHHDLVAEVLRNPIVLSKVIRRLVKNSNKYESVSPVAELLSTLSHVEPKIVKLLVKSVLRRHHHELPVEVVLSKVIRRLVKSFERRHESSLLSTLSHIAPRRHSLVRDNVEEVCRVCESVCESPLNFESSIFSTSTKVCRVCAKVCPTVAPAFGRHFDF